MAVSMAATSYRFWQRAHPSRCQLGLLGTRYRQIGLGEVTGQSATCLSPGNGTGLNAGPAMSFQLRSCKHWLFNGGIANQQPRRYLQLSGDDSSGAVNSQLRTPVLSMRVDFRDSSGSRHSATAVPADPSKYGSSCRRVSGSPSCRAVAGRRWIELVRRPWQRKTLAGSLVRRASGTVRSQRSHVSLYRATPDGSGSQRQLPDRRFVPSWSASGIGGGVDLQKPSCRAIGHSDHRRRRGASVADVTKERYGQREQHWVN